MSFRSKNLYNKANYIIRQEFINNNKWVRYHQLASDLKRDEDFKSLPRKVSQHVLMRLDQNWKAFFKAIKEWKKNPKKFTGKPSLPKYKDKNRGRNLLIYSSVGY